MISVLWKDANGEQGLMFWCAGCITHHSVPRRWTSCLEVEW